MHQRRPGAPLKLQKGFTLIEIMIVVAILGIVLSIAAGTWLRQRNSSQQRVCQENLAKIDGAKELWALENNNASDAVPVWADLVAADGSGYLKKQPVCPASGTYTIDAVNQDASCSIVAPVDHNEKP